ncbi:MAG: hypothetical protein ACYTEP_08475 [Planctomycetota bacterium]
MLLSINLELPGFQDAVAELLPKGLILDGCSLDERSLRLDCRAPIVGKVKLTAQVRVTPGRLCLHGFNLEGAGLAKSMILGKLRERLSELDHRPASLRVWGDSDGSAAYVSWPS